MAWAALRMKNNTEATQSNSTFSSVSFFLVADLMSGGEGTGIDLQTDV